MAPHHQVKRPCSIFLPLRVWCYSICSTCSKFQSGDLLWSFLSKCLQGGALFIAREEKGLARFLLVLHDSSELPDAFGKRGIVSLPFILVLVAEIGCGECVNSRNELRLMPVGALAQETWLHFVAHLRRGRAAKGGCTGWEVLWVLLEQSHLSLTSFPPRMMVYDIHWHHLPGGHWVLSWQ